MLRLFFVLAGLLTVVGCTNPNDLNGPRKNLGNFTLGHNVVVAPHPVKGPASREASPEEWIASMKGAIAERFDSYEGTKFYHLGISIDGYVLAQPGIPLVLSPKSVLILNVTVWDDALGKKLTPKPEQITVLESLSGETMVGSGLTQSAEQQMSNLSRNAAKMIENWLVKQNKKEKWFKDAPGMAKPVAVEPAEPVAAPKVAASKTPIITETSEKIHAVGPVIE
jgi:hypothetical protein